ncbi:hypothetical protein MACH08_07680 [Oceanobacillus kimchii]|uniref:Uncharacterized protein n=1 Tax=Oceanobacillus kimchii TaxID=746691 RepID=A0ABQ5THE7_9BACI|nr:hypothetical protein MACH08_07680 [Oceanobacillus kimchii]
MLLLIVFIILLINILTIEPKLSKIIEQNDILIGIENKRT